jgi:hypothetical protein
LNRSAAVPDILGIIRIDPLQHAERQKQDVHALFLFQQNGVSMHLEKALL